jgi:dihydrofolate reductase
MSFSFKTAAAGGGYGGGMRKVTALLFMSLDGVVESPDKFVRKDVFSDLLELIRETIAEQDTVLLGRVMYEEWAEIWPTSTMEPFAPFINRTPKLVVSRTLRAVGWSQCSLMEDALADGVAKLKAQPGKAIGVHGSIGLVQSMLGEGLLDELRLIVFPAIAGRGRRLVERDGESIQLDLQSAKSTPTGLQYVVVTPRR